MKKIEQRGKVEKRMCGMKHNDACALLNAHAELQLGLVDEDGVLEDVDRGDVGLLGTVV